MQKNKIEIVICTEKGYLESMSKLLVASLREFGGEFKDVPIFSYQPRKEFQIFLEKNNIQTRTVFTGNIIKQPVFKGINYKKNIEGYKESNHIMKNGMLIGCHHGMGIKEIYFIKQKINEFLKINNENIVYKF